MRIGLTVGAGLFAIAVSAVLLPGLASVDGVVAHLWGGSAAPPVPPRHPMTAASRTLYDARRIEALTAPDPASGLPPLPAMIGQLLVVGFAGDELTDPPAQKILADIGDGRVGGILYFAHNVASQADVRAMNVAFQAAAPQLPLLIAVDQEGGKVQRLNDRVGFAETPSAADVAALSPQDRRATYDALASGLSRLGFNLNLGPVVDLGVEPSNTVVVLNGRTYGAAPAPVIDAARDFVLAHRAEGIATALKHFPGHGSSVSDSHKGAVDISKTWSADELLPYTALNGAGLADMVMVGHLTLDPAEGPISLADGMIDAMLRDGVGFSGLTISDDLTMGAAAEGSGEQTVVDAVMAGNDLIIVSGSMDGLEGDLVSALHTALSEAAETDADVRARVVEAYRNVSAFKLARFGAAERRARLAALLGPTR